MVKCWNSQKALTLTLYKRIGFISFATFWGNEAVVKSETKIPNSSARTCRTNVIDVNREFDLFNPEHLTTLIHETKLTGPGGSRLEVSKSSDKIKHILFSLRVSNRILCNREKSDQKDRFEWFLINSIKKEPPEIRFERRGGGKGPITLPEKLRLMFFDRYEFSRSNAARFGEHRAIISRRTDIFPGGVRSPVGIRNTSLTGRHYSTHLERKVTTDNFTGRPTTAD